MNHLRKADQERGARSYHAGLSAEARISLEYERGGYCIKAHRWRSTVGEIDLIAQNGKGVIFVEVKQSRHFETALQHIHPKQIRRLYESAEEYLGHMPNGSLTEVRFDVALVNGQGEIKIIENAFGYN